MFCGNCGTELKEDECRCPNCGAETSAGRQIQDSFNAVNAVATQSQTITEEATKAKPKKKWSPRKKFFAGAIGIVVVAIIIGIIGSNAGETIDVEFVESNVNTGLSTTVTIDEFINYYNESLCDYLGIQDEFTFLLSGGLELGENVEIINLEEEGLTFYHWQQPMGTRDSEVGIWVARDTGCVSQVMVAFSLDAVLDAPDSDAALRNRYGLLNAAEYAFCGGDSDSAGKIHTILSDLIQDDKASTQWQDNISVMVIPDMGGKIAFNIMSITEDAHNQSIKAVE